ncbi:MAG: MBL fold metallo-hydrolase [Hoeflea sp.]|uniref:MBL fold metallo-hydrolase n=1 Tax=Hoeflea sp. TaxID=1940281 RepID=UPI001D9FA651|nr:MBL fold metallo-hydrolase [Hoeflea sp.]MBU4528808.1 MBL fold metallo-hydrolase [Alphaproteobacteria bacterium]MBU4545865.1 MBL fold metallo-hydrolase [Alphaproteobacteria bacterium]MBU4549942.1 MBL fold metallo-hydrolase [Alphaproteobacteria bacterium]MBV1725939.1 MBL fold metallo-hydrolase [Hoeflea sp.]MBV1762664.1 MBL fold metallo-hydrolase [Hoeflea sp.]
MTSLDLTRRNLLRTSVAAAGALLLPVGLRPARALEIGEAVLSTVSDGNLVLPLDFSYPDVPMDELVALLTENGQPTDTLTPECNVPFLKSGDRLIMFDVGSGPNFMPSAGKLLDNMAEAGFDPADVTDVVFTHCHPDHLWGLVDDFDEVLFSNASFHMGRAEWEFWRDPGTVDAMPEERKTFAVGAQNRLAHLEDMINLFEPGAEVLPGVEAVDTAGHTPGHMAFLLHGGSEPVLVAGDALTHFAMSFQHPAWPSGSDQDPEMGVATRLKLLDRLATDKAALTAYHLPRPGEGRVERDGTAYRFVASG